MNISVDGSRAADRSDLNCIARVGQSNSPGPFRRSGGGSSLDMRLDSAVSHSQPLQKRPRSYQFQAACFADVRSAGVCMGRLGSPNMMHKARWRLDAFQRKATNGTRWIPRRAREEVEEHSRRRARS